MKKIYKIAVIFCIIVAILLISTVINAYYTSKKYIEKEVIFGYNEIEIIENFEPQVKLEKGQSLKREICIKNSGNVDCYIRVKPIISDSRVLDSINLNYNLIDFSYNKNDGYYYYNEKLSPGNNTTPIFTTISISENAEDFVLEGFEIYTCAEAVQTIQNKSMADVWSYFNK